MTTTPRSHAPGDVELLERLARARADVLAQVGHRIVGQKDVLDGILTAIFSGGHALLVRAFRVGEASVVAPFQYSQIIWGCLYGVLLFATPVEPHTVLGAAIIILSGWLVLRGSSERLGA